MKQFTDHVRKSIKIACICISVGIYRLFTQHDFSETIFDLNNFWDILQDLKSRIEITYTLEDYLAKFANKIEEDISRMILKLEDQKMKSMPNTILFIDNIPSVEECREIIIQSWTQDYYNQIEEYKNQVVKKHMIRHILESYAQIYGTSHVEFAEFVYWISIERIKYYQNTIYYKVSPEHDIYNSIGFLRENYTDALVYWNTLNESTNTDNKIVLKSIININLQDYNKKLSLLCPFIDRDEPDGSRNIATEPRRASLSKPTACDCEPSEARSADLEHKRIFNVNEILEYINKVPQKNKNHNILDDYIINKKSFFFNLLLQSRSVELLKAYNIHRIQTNTMTYFIKELPEIVKIFKSAVFCENRTEMQNILCEQFMLYMHKSGSIYRKLFNNKEFDTLIKTYRHVQNEFNKIYTQYTNLPSDIVKMIYTYL